MNSSTIVNGINYVKQTGTILYNNLPSMAPGAAALTAMSDLSTGTQGNSTILETPQFIASTVIIGITMFIGACVVYHKMHKECCAESSEEKRRLPVDSPQKFNSNSAPVALKRDEDSDVVSIKYIGGDNQEDDGFTLIDLEEGSVNSSDDDELPSANQSAGAPLPLTLPHTPAKKSSDELDVPNIWTNSGTPAGVAKRYRTKIDLRSPRNPDPALRPKDPDGRSAFTPVQTPGKS
jgi:hypothetical protein